MSTVDAVFETIKAHASLVFPAIAAVVVVLITSEKHSLKVAASRISAGLFCAIVFTDPTIDWIGLDSDVYRSATSGLWAMTGFQVVKFVSSLDAQKIAEIIKALRGK